MKWEKPELKDLNAQESASAGCGNGSGNATLGGCTDGSNNVGYRYKEGHFDGACAQGFNNAGG